MSEGERGQLLDELAAMRLQPAEWADLGDELRAVSAHDRDALAQVVFEARVHRRFHGGRARSTLPPTRKTSALPWVGLVCGGLLLAVGGALGGGPVLVGVALLGIFVFAVAMAGSRVTHARPAASGGSTTEPVPPPDFVREEIARLRSG